jgi:chromosome segregation ATPase
MPTKVLGRVMDLVKPTQRKYETAITVVLGRNIDSIVVDTEATAVACIQDMRNARAGIATFLPLDTLSVKPIRDKFRSYSKNARLAIDVVQYDNAVEKAVHFVCSTAMVCDTIEVAKYVCYDKGQEVKGAAACSMLGPELNRGSSCHAGWHRLPQNGPDYGRRGQCDWRKEVGRDSGQR